MHLKCKLCNNQARFEAEARAKVRVVVDGQGRISDGRVVQQIFEDVIVLQAVACKACGASGSVVDLDAADVGASPHAPEIRT